MQMSFTGMSNAPQQQFRQWHHLKSYIQATGERRQIIALTNQRAFLKRFSKMMVHGLHLIVSCLS